MGICHMCGEMGIRHIGRWDVNACLSDALLVILRIRKLLISGSSAVNIAGLFLQQS